MDIRSVTLFCEPEFPAERMAGFITAVRAAFPFPVQSARLALPPFPNWWPEDKLDQEVSRAWAHTLAKQWQVPGADYISLGPVQLRHEPHWIDLIPELLCATEVLFATVEIADMQGQIDLNRIRQTARLIKKVSQLQANGFGNLYLAALANCPPGSPFFPVAYHRGGAPHFAVALEPADLVLAAIKAAGTLAEARENLVQAIETAAAQITHAAYALAAERQIYFSGIDFSLAPYPGEAKSIGRALEALGISALGNAGTLFAAGFVTEAISRANFPHCGFSGLMLPVLEDSVLAGQAGAGTLTVSDLLTYSAVCGVGLDTIPLPGDVTEEALTAVLLDVAMLATRLKKPLTARLMPLPGLQAGEPVTFDFPYFANGRVMAVRSGQLTNLLAQPARLTVQRIR